MANLPDIGIHAFRLRLLATPRHVISTKFAYF